MALREKNGSDHSDDQRKLAVLVDADNAQASVIDGLLAEIAKYGVASVKRIYGDWTQSNLAPWKETLLKYSIDPKQQFAYTKAKNATDIALVIDAMDLMHTHRFDGFCLVSSDSDFTPLARRLREEGLLVLGFGEEKTPEAFRAACDKFIFTEVLRPAPTVALPVAETQSIAQPTAQATAKKTTTAAKKATKSSATATSEEPTTSAAALPLVRQAIEQAADDSGWAFLGAIGNYVSKIRTDFDSRLYGHKKLSDLIKSHPSAFQWEERGNNAGAKNIYVRVVKSKQAK